MKELVPEFFYLPDAFRNRSMQLPLGACQNGERVDDVVLPPWVRACVRRACVRWLIFFFVPSYWLSSAKAASCMFTHASTCGRRGRSVKLAFCVFVLYAIMRCVRPEEVLTSLSVFTVPRWSPTTCRLASITGWTSSSAINSVERLPWKQTTCFTT